MDLKKGIDEAKNYVLDFFEEISIPCENLEDFYKIALVSSNYDLNIAEVVSEAIRAVGPYLILIFVIEETELLILNLDSKGCHRLSSKTGFLYKEDWLQRTFFGITKPSFVLK